MRGRAALLALLAVAAALAGCAAKGPAEPPVAAAPPPPEARQETFQAHAYVGTAPGCTVSVCSGGRFPDEVYTVPDDANLTALHLEFGAVSGLDEAVSWKVWCESDADGACLRAFGHGHDKLPLTLDLPADAPAGAQVLLELVAPRMTPAPIADTLVSLAWGQSHVDGAATLLANASAPHAPPRLAVNVSVDGHSGPCLLLAEANCSQWPGGTPFYYGSADLGGSVVGLDLTMTWTSTSPLDQELVLDARAVCGNTCPDSVSTKGTSPLHLVATGVSMPDGLVLDPSNADAVFGRSFAGTRTPLHIEGVLWVQPDPAVEE
jgi:predicted small lipoprotein YifL